MRRDEFFRDARADCTGPLEGIRVLEATTSWAGPMGGCILADFGAEVIKVEHPDGEIARKAPPFVPGTNDKLSFVNEVVNRNKKSLALDLRADAGRDLFLQLARTADVVLENFRPGTLDSWGVGYQAVKAVRDDIVYVSVSGFGQFGPLHQSVGYDPIAQAFSGWMSLNGEVDGAPVKAASFLGDDLAGIYAALSAVSALRHRDRTGEGQHVDVALVDGIFAHSDIYQSMAAMGVKPQRLGNQFPVAAPFNVYACTDGHVYAGAIVDGHWRKLTALIGCPELADEPRYASLAGRVDARDELDTLVERWCADKSTEYVVDAFRDAGIPVTPVNDFEQACASEQIVARGMLQDTTLSDGTSAPLLGPAPKFSRTPVAIRSPAPPLGAHTDELLEEIGITSEVRAQLRSDRVI